MTYQRGRHAVRLRAGSLIATLAAALLLAGCGGSGSSSPAPGPTSSSAPAAQQRVGPGRAALFIGDSYTTGGGTPGPADGFARKLCDARGWTCTLDGQGGTGFINNDRTGIAPSAESSNYGGRLVSDRNRYTPDLVVISGGRNDFHYPVARLTVAATNYLTHVRAAFPKAVLVIVAPFWSDANPPAAAYALRDQERQVAAQLQATFIDPLGEHWVTATNAGEYFGTAAIHPTPAGHIYLARRLGADLAKAGI